VISWIYYWIKYDAQHEIAQRLLASPATTYDISENVAATFAEYKGKNWQAIMSPNVEALERLVSDLERRGARIFLLDCHHLQNSAPMSML
jgi:hypothetical protein